MKELTEAIANATNVETLFYNKDSDNWEITFYKGEPTKVYPDNLIDYLNTFGS